MEDCDLRRCLINGAKKMRDDTSTIDHADLRRELKEVCEAIAALQRRVNLIELSQRPCADRTAETIRGVSARALDDRLRHIEDVIDLLNRHMVQLIASYGDRIKKLEQGTRATSSLVGRLRKAKPAIAAGSKQEFAWRTPILRGRRYASWLEGTATRSSR
jgi:hypothetical protein